MDGLVDRARTGDVEAFSTLYERYARRVHAYCMSRVRQPADAEDLTQLTFLKVVEALPRYESRGLPFAAWLFTLARNVVIDFVRARRDHAALDELRDGELAVDDPAPSAAADSLAASLPFLTLEQRDVIAYRFFAGLSVRETAQLMGREEAAVRALQHRALAALRRRMETDEQRAGACERAVEGGRGRRMLAPIRTRTAEP